MSELFTPLPQRVIAYYNPASGHAEEAEASIYRLTAALGMHGVGVVKLETERAQADMNESVREHAQTGDALVVASGDGGTASVLEAARGSNIPVATIGGGSTNDLPHMLHPNKMLSHPEQIFQRGVVLPLRPLLVTATLPSGETIETYTYAYWSTGTSADAAHIYSDDKDVRAELKALEAKHFGKIRRFRRESEIAIDTLHASPYFIVTDEQGSRRIVEINVPNGELEAKAFHFRLSILRDGGGIFEVTNPTIRSMVRAVVPAMCLPLRPVDAQHPASFKIETEADKATGIPAEIPVQANGEFSTYPSGTSYVIAPAPAVTNVYASRRKYRRLAAQILQKRVA